MPEFYDDNESRPPELRERELHSKLPDLITRAMHAPGWAEQLANVDPGSVTSRAVLAVLPVLRKSNLKERQLASPPFGGFLVTPQTSTDVPRPDLRAGRPRHRLVERGARPICCRVSPG